MRNDSGDDGMDSESNNEEADALEGAVDARDTSTTRGPTKPTRSSHPLAVPTRSPLFTLTTLSHCNCCCSLDCLLLSRAADRKLPLRIEC